MDILRWYSTSSPRPSGPRPPPSIRVRTEAPQAHLPVAKTHLQEAGRLRERGRNLAAAAEYRNAAVLYSRAHAPQFAAAALRVALRILEGDLPRNSPEFASVAIDLAEHQLQLGFPADAQQTVASTLDRLENADQRNAGHVIANWAAEQAARDMRWLMLRRRALRIAGLHRSAVAGREWEEPASGPS